MSASKRVMAFQSAAEPFIRFFQESIWSRRRFEQGIADFVVGNPHEMPLPGFVDALQRASVPQNKDWFAYQNNEPASQVIIADSLRKSHGMDFHSQDIMMTTGGFAGISLALNALVEPGDEVIFISPPWFFYEGLIAAVDAVPVRVKVQIPGFDLDLAAIERAITSKTRAILINSPHNPTGKIYPDSTLRALAALLEQASQRNGQPIYLFSDEAYNRIVFDNSPYLSPAAYYADSLLIYTYGKVLLTPGQRIGYVALPPTMSDRAAVRQSLFMAQIFLGFCFPNALLQHALKDLDTLSIDIAHLQRKRDRLVDALQGMGYEVERPDGTFYLLPRSPVPDDEAFIKLLAEQNVFCLPGSVVELPGYFRISLTANDDMIDRGLPGFEAALAAARARL